MRIKELFESRRNPHLNPKYTANDILSMHSGNRNAFIHFTDQNKIGINPVLDPRYPNPFGVYSYPIQEVKRATQNFNTPIFDKLFAGDAKNIFLFEYRSSNPLILSSTNIQTRAFDLVKDFFITEGKGNRLEEIERSYHKNISNRAEYLWKFVFEMIDLLRMPSSKTSFIIFHKVLGYDMVLDDGLNMMYGGSRSSINSQAVHFDTRKIKVIELIENKRDEPSDRISARDEYKARDIEIQNDNRSQNDRYMVQMSIKDAKIHVTDGEYPRHMSNFTKIAHMIETNPMDASKHFFNQLLSFSDEISRTGVTPTEEEISHTKSIALALHYSTGLRSGLDELDDILPDMIFDLNQDLISKYRKAARTALSELGRA